MNPSQLDTQGLDHLLERLEWDGENTLYAYLKDAAAAIRDLQGRERVLREAAEPRAGTVWIQTSDRLAGYVLSCRLNNTRDWMAGMADEINKYAEATNQRERWRFDGDGFIRS